MNDFKTKLKEWSEKAVEYCNPIADKINRAYYVFQSEPEENPRVLLLGLNPGGRMPYQKFYSETDQCEWNGQCETWDLPDGMTAECLSRQNPWYFKGKNYDPKKKWNILLKLKTTISASQALEECLENMVYMNLLYFSSADFIDFQKCAQENGEDWREIYTKCAEMTKELVFDIIKPQIIICLGIKNCFEKFRNGEAVEVEKILPGSLHKCTVKGIDVYGMTHPSAPINNEIRRQIGIYLSNQICGTNLSDKR